MSDYSAMNVTQLQQESARLESRISEMDRDLADMRANFGALRSELAKRLRASPEPRMSEHALLRYIERVYGVDVEAVRAEVMTPAIVAALKTGATAVTVKGVKMLAKDGTIVTVVTDEMKNAGKHKRTRAYDTDDDDEAFQAGVAKGMFNGLSGKAKGGISAIEAERAMK